MTPVFRGRNVKARATKTSWEPISQVQRRTVGSRHERIKHFPYILQVNPLVVKFLWQIIINFFAAAVRFIARIVKIDLQDLTPN